MPATLSQHETEYQKMVERLKPPIYREMPMPEWKNGPFEGWSRKWVHKNGRRTQTVIGDYEDALQHCAMLFAKVLSRYGKTAESHANLMALYKTAVINSWKILSVIDKRKRMPGTSVRVTAIDHYLHSYSAGPLQVALDDLSPRASTALVRLMEARSAGNAWRYLPPKIKSEICDTFFCDGDFGQTKRNRLEVMPGM